MFLTLMNKPHDPLIKLVGFSYKSRHPARNSMRTKTTINPLGQSIGLVVLLVATSAILLFAASSF